jgi:6-phosphogluconolactonase
MANRALRLSTMSLVLSSFAALAACGSKNNPTVCPADGCCGGSSALCVAPQYVYANGTDGQVYVFPVDNSTGAVSSPTSISGASMSLGMATLNNQFLYVSNPSANLNQGSSIDALSINLGTGALTTVAGSPFSLGPASFSVGLATDNATQTLYVAEGGQIDALKADATGALTLLPGSPFLSGLNFYLTVDPQNRFLFATDNIVPASVFALTIDSSTGALTAVPGSPFAMGASGGGLQLGIVADSSGKFVYTVMQSTSQVAGFSIASPSGALTPIPGSPFSTGSAPIALATVNNFLYVSNVGDGTLSGYSIDSTTGVLTPLAGSPFAIRAGALTTNSSGSFLYTAGSDGMMAFKIDATSGILTQVGSAIPFAGATVLSFVQ